MIGRRQARPWDGPFQDVELVAEGEVLQFQCDAGAEGRPKNGQESWQDTHRKRVAARRVNSIISSSSEFPVGTDVHIVRILVDRERRQHMLYVGGKIGFTTLGAVHVFPPSPELMN